MSVGLSTFNCIYAANPELVLAAPVIETILPLSIFFMAQRVFMQSIVITGRKVDRISLPLLIRNEDSFASVKANAVPKFACKHREEMNLYANQSSQTDSGY
jgi:hypothetical protein